MRKTPNMINTGDIPVFTGAMAPPEEQAEFHAEDIQAVSIDRLDYKAKEAKFMNELIKIEIEPGTEPNDPMYVQLGHNGDNQMVLRGCPQAIKRKYLYSALMSRKVSMNCTFQLGPNGASINKLTPSSNTTYRAALVDDPNPQGGPRWVQRVMAEQHGVRA